MAEQSLAFKCRKWRIGGQQQVMQLLDVVGLLHAIRFNDVGYFRQIFQKHTGLTPAAWKRRYSKEHINS
ncbi:bacterial regulatory helix-turn-helix s, AraC family protein [Escherichia coli P0305260.10]|nr:bacterial regulatory helix-turn-helix s, AraC family protein [Escherichia coli P0305260.10]